MSNRSVYGTMTITVTVTKPTHFFIVHALDYKTIDGLLKNSMKKDIAVKRKFLYSKNQFYVMELEDDAEAGTYYLNFKFSYMLKKELKGFYQSTYRNKDNKEMWVKRKYIKNRTSGSVLLYQGFQTCG